MSYILDVIERYKKKIEDLEKDLKDILKQEETEKQVRFRCIIKKLFLLVI